MTQPPEYPGEDNGTNEPPSWQGGQGQDPGQQPPAYGQPSYGDQPPAYGQPAYGQDPYGQDPYGQGAYGQHPYGQGDQYGAWQGGNDLQQKNNGTSIAALVLNVTPCGLVIPGWICAIIGLRQIKRDGSKGRWMAITSLVMGVLWAILFAALIFGGIWLFKNVVTPDNAEVGQCVDISTEEDNEIGLMKKDCSDEHDGEVVVVHDVTADDLENAVSDIEICSNLLGEEEELSSAVDERRDEVDLKGVVESPPPEEGDTLVCYVEAKDGKLTEKITP